MKKKIIALSLSLILLLTLFLPTVFAETETQALVDELCAAEDFDSFYTILLSLVNGEESLDDLMSLTTDEIFVLSDKAVELYSAIEEPTELQTMDYEDALLTFSMLPNYREKCVDCGSYPCVCESDADGYMELYERLTKANTVRDYIDITSILTELEMEEFRLWLQENDLYASYTEHENQILSSSITGVTYPAKKYSLAKSTGNVSSDALKMNKTAVYNNATGLYDITLETYTTGVVEEGQVLPADTVLVLDVSGSMDFEYTSKRIGTPMYGDYFKHSTLNSCWWGWENNDHLVDGKNPYVLLPDGTFAEAAYSATDSNNVEIFRVVKSGELFYPTMLSESLNNVPRQYSYPVYQLYSSTAENTYTVDTGLPMFGSKFVADSITYYGWLSDSHLTEGVNPYIQLADGTFANVWYKRTDAKRVEVFAYTDADTGLVTEFYPRLTEKDNGVTRAEDLPVIQMYSSHNTTRMPALQNAVAEFLRMTAKNNEKMPAGNKNRVSFVQFSCNTAAHTSRPTQLIKGFTEVTADNVDELISFTYSITDGGPRTHTEIGKGMEVAEETLGAVSRTSHKAVIAFTDGYPEACNGDGWGQAERAIAAASRLTKNYNATIYSVCIQGDAVVNANSGLPENSGNANRINRFMHLLSNNYPNATSMTVTGTGSTDSGYYLVPGSEGDLTSIFTHIGEQIGNATINLDSSTTVIDYVTSYFAVPKGATIDISVEDADYSKNILTWNESDMDTKDITYQFDETNNALNVTGFDYNHNFVASVGREEGNIANPGDFYGRKLVIKFSVKPNDDFLGGNQVPTNTDQSGVYVNDSMVGAFDVPMVNVPVTKIEPEFSSNNIYLSQLANMAQIVNLGHFVKEIDGKKEFFTVDTVNNAFVDIEYTITDGKTTYTYTLPAGGSLLGNYWGDSGIPAELLKDDKTYTVTCTVTPKTSGEYGAVPAEKQVTVYVFKPEITFKDSAIQLGETADYEADNFVSVNWVNDDPNAKTPEGAAPTLEYAYTPAEADFKEDTDVKVTVTAKGNNGNIPKDQDITKYVTFYRDACSFKGCTNTTKTKVSATDANRVNFVVHLKTFDLIIDKVVKDGLDVNQTFLFRVTGENNFSMDVTVVGDGEVSIKNLPAGEYTVTELTDWSWRYQADKTSEEISAANAVNGKVTSTFTNTRTKPYWLSGDWITENIFGAFGQAN